MKQSYYVIIRGPLGIGKSTIAESLAKKLDAEYIAIDRIVDDPNLITREIEEGYISQRSFLKANEIAVERIKNALAEGRPVIFDGNFYWKSAIQDLEKRLKDYEGFVFTLKAHLDVCIQRDANRNKAYGKDAAKAVYNKSVSFRYGITINTKDRSPDDIVSEIISYIQKRRRDIVKE